MSLISYARFYAQLNEIALSDRPDDAVIENDEALDRWWDNYVRDAYRKASKRMQTSDEALLTVPTFQG